MRIYNTLSHTVEDFNPLNANEVKMYCCGPTVYDYTHLGHLFKYIMDDTMVRSLRYLEYTVTHVMNITDVGHLVSDEDMGEDKLEKGARKTGKTVWEVADFYTEFFNRSMEQVGVQKPNVTCKATDHIPEMVELIRKLQTKGFTYETPEAVYFDTSMFVGYGKLAGQKLEEKKKAVREEVVDDPNKKNPSDFALWFKQVGRFSDHTMHWESPWGKGFPGWHIECSAMSMKYLGPQIDIHTGGVDHIPVHHTNEIAQSEAATGKSPFVRYWVHHNFLKVEGEKMSKSLNNFFTIDDLIQKGFDPQALRYLVLQAHYRTEMNFTWDALTAAQTALYKLQHAYQKLAENESTKEESGSHITLFRQALEDDFNFAQALGVIWHTIKSDLAPAAKRAFLEESTRVLGFDIKTQSGVKNVIPTHIIELAQKRKESKEQKDYALADSLRKKIENEGYVVSDHKDGGFELNPV